MKYNIECTLLHPRLQDYSYKGLKNEDLSSIIEVSTPLKVCLFLSCHIADIRHKGTILQAKELPCLPSLCLHPTNISGTLLGITHWTQTLKTGKTTIPGKQHNAVMLHNFTTTFTNATPIPPILFLSWLEYPLLKNSPCCSPHTQKKKPTLLLLHYFIFINIQNPWFVTINECLKADPLQVTFTLCH